MLVLNLPAFKGKKYTADDHFHGNSPCGKVLTKKEPIRTLGFTLPYNKATYFLLNFNSTDKEHLIRETFKANKRMENMFTRHFPLG